MKNKSIYPWVVVGLLWIVALLNYMDRQMLSTMQEAMKVDIVELNKAEAFGALMAIFLWIYGFMSPVAGIIADRVNRKWLVVGSLFVWSAVTFLMGYAHNFHELYWLRAVMGVSEALYIPSALSLIADWHEGKSRSLAVGVHMTGLYVGQAIGGFGATAAAAFLIGTFREQDGQLETWKNDFIVGVQELLHNEQNRQVVRISDFKRSVQVVLTGNRTNLKLLSQRLDHASENYIRNRQVYFDRLKMKITGRIDVLADRQRNRLENFGKPLQQQTGRIFADQHRRLELAATTIKYVDPKNVLERGYSITRLNGKAVRKAAVLQAGEIVETELAHGKIQCQILNNSVTQ